MSWVKICLFISRSSILFQWSVYLSLFMLQFCYMMRSGTASSIALTHQNSCGYFMVSSWFYMNYSHFFPKPVKCDLDISISIAFILYINFATIDVFVMLFQLFRNMGFFSFSSIFCCYILGEKLTHHHTYKDKLVFFIFGQPPSMGQSRRMSLGAKTQRRLCFLKCNRPQLCQSQERVKALFMFFLNKVVISDTTR